jgi:hypothetical protein
LSFFDQNCEVCDQYGNGSQGGEHRRGNDAYSSHGQRNFDKRVSLFILDNNPAHVAGMNQVADLVDQFPSTHLELFVNHSRIRHDALSLSNSPNEGGNLGDQRALSRRR